MKDILPLLGCSILLIMPSPVPVNWIVVGVLIYMIWMVRR
jgi:hypothetical protein